MIKTVLFDFDGTVFDTLEGIVKSTQYALRKQGIEAELGELRCFAGPPLIESFMEHYGFDRAQAEQATADFRERYLPTGCFECRVFPGMGELLAHLRKAGLRLGIATSKLQSTAEQMLEREGLRNCFDAVCGAQDDASNVKWRIVERAVQQLRADKESTVLVGDTKWDVAGAHRCGIPCIGVGYGYAAPGELEEAGADLLAADLAELEALLLHGAKSGI